MRELAIGICQLTSAIGSADYDPRPDNLEKALKAIAETAEQGAKLIVFGEIYLNGYETNEFTPLYLLAESDDDPYVARLVQEARDREIFFLLEVVSDAGRDEPDPARHAGERHSLHPVVIEDVARGAMIACFLRS